jgi:TolB-like protein
VAGLAVAAAAPADSVAKAATQVAMLPFVVHTADTQPGYLSGGLVEMISSRLQRTGELRVVRVEADRGITRADEARKLARDTGADFVLFGSFTQFGTGASLDVQCVPLEGEDEASRRVFIHSGSVAEIIPQLDELAEKVRRYVLDGEVIAATPGQANGGSGAISATEYEDLLYRLDALERTVYDAPPSAPAPEPAAAAEEELEGAQAASAESEGEAGEASDGQTVR